MNKTQEALLHSLWLIGIMITVMLAVVGATVSEVSWLPIAVVIWNWAFLIYFYGFTQFKGIKFNKHKED